MGLMDAQAAALLSHVVAQIEQNVNFLASQNYISQSDASVILTKLPNVDVNHPANQFSNVKAAARAVPPPPQPVVAQDSALPKAKAVWGYNEDGQDPNDLQFLAGDIIDIVEESNADWWVGRFNNRQGLFPSAYVEKVVTVAKSTKPYKPFGAAYHGLAPPPPPNQAVNDVGLQEKPGSEEKKSKLDGFKGTLAHSAVGGVGFGAGTAIGGGLVRAIF